MTSSPVSRVVYNGKRPSSTRSPSSSEIFTPAHEENVRFIYEAAPSGNRCDPHPSVTLHVAGCNVAGFPGHLLHAKISGNCRLSTSGVAEFEISELNGHRGYSVLFKQNLSRGLSMRTWNDQRKAARPDSLLVVTVSAWQSVERDLRSQVSGTDRGVVEEYVEKTPNNTLKSFKPVDLNDLKRRSTQDPKKS